MTIHSMPNNKKFADNYDRIFNKTLSGADEPQKGDEIPIVDSIWLVLAENYSTRDFIWHQVAKRGRGEMLDVPPGVYVVSQYWRKGRMSFNIQMSCQHSNALHYQAVDELIEGLEYCSNYGGKYTS